MSSQRPGRCAGGKISRNPRRLHLLVPPPHRLRAADAGAGARRGDRHAPPRRHSRPRGLRRAHLGGGRPLQQRRLVASPKVRPRRSARVPRAGGRRGRVRDRRGAHRGSPAPLHRHRRPAKLRSVRDRHRSERHVHVAGGVWVLRLSTRRSHPHRSRRVRQQRHRVPPGRGANRRRRRVRPVRRARAARRVGAGEDDSGQDQGARAIGVGDARAHERGTGQPGVGDRRGDLATRDPVPPGRVSERGSDAGGRGGDRVRPARGHRAQVPARAPRGWVFVRPGGVCRSHERAAGDARPARRQVGLDGHVRPRAGSQAVRAVRGELRRQGWIRGGG
mmetsp:Transcript_14433/g.60997  ORF Transcript_14433/g.60997 Transcript_14433/m.60997 type:complete len:333 (+) Transcript_14433:174-1172(+)